MASVTAKCNGTYGSYYTIKLEYILNSQNVANNTSNITVKLTSYRLPASANGAWCLDDWKNSAKLSVDNVQRVNRNLDIDMRNGKTVSLASWTGNITHSGDGKKTVAMSGSFSMPSSTGCSGGSVSYSWALPTIPRASTISSVTGSVAAGGTATVNIARKSSAFTHEVTWTMGGYTAKQTNVGTSASFAIPMNWINAIPNSTSGTATVKVQTKNGSTNIGSAVSRTFTVTVPASVVPTLNVSVSRVDGAVPAAWGIYLKGKSRATAAISGAAGSYSSTIKSYSISGGGSSSTLQTMTTNLLNTTGTVTFTAKATDSRGRTATKTASISVVDYFTPYVTGASAYRCNSAGQADPNGTYCKVTATANFAGCNGKNGFRLQARHRQTGGGAWSDSISLTSGSNKVVGGNLSTEYSHEVEISLEDHFTGTTWATTLPTALYTMHFKKGGKGVAFGKASEKDNLLDTDWGLRSSAFGGATESLVKASLDGTLSRAAINGAVSNVLGATNNIVLVFTDVKPGVYLLAIRGNHNPLGHSGYLSVWTAILTVSCGYAAPDVVCRLRLTPLSIAAGMGGAGTDANFAAMLEGEKTQVPYAAYNQRVYVRVSRDNIDATAYQANLIKLI